MDEPEKRRLSLGDSPPGFRSGFVSIVGRPNVGKSTLLNQILRRKVAIVSPHPQTTRNALRGVMTTDDAQIVFVDTPGLHKPRSALGKSLNQVVRNTMSGVDVIVFVLDVAEGAGGGDAYIANELLSHSTPVIVAMNKVDLVPPEELDPREAKVGELGPLWMRIRTSARVGEGVSELLTAIVDLLPEGPVYYPPDAVTDQDDAVLIAELVREKLLEQMHEEIPHSIAVVVEEMREDENGVLNIDVTIYVERESQKGIVIGKSGRVLKDAGTKARAEIEQTLGRRVFLSQRVKVSRDWQYREGMPERFGYAR
jgi:GTP-binding protein Era